MKKICAAPLHLSVLRKLINKLKPITSDTECFGCAYVKVSHIISKLPDDVHLDKKIESGSAAKCLPTPSIERFPTTVQAALQQEVGGKGKKTKQNPHRPLKVIVFRLRRFITTLFHLFRSCLQIGCQGLGLYVSCCTYISWCKLHHFAQSLDLQTRQRHSEHA